MFIFKVAKNLTLYVEGIIVKFEVYVLIGISKDGLSGSCHVHGYHHACLIVGVTLGIRGWRFLACEESPDALN